MILSKYNKVVVLTRETKNEWLREKQIENKEINPNPLPFYPKKVSNCENKTIISVGRLEEQKGYDELIEVWSKLFQKYPEWKLEIYGEGSLRKKLQQNPYVKQKLLQTKDYIIVEDSPKDNFWGWGKDRTGENHLGKLWMKLRDELLK